MSEPLVVCQQLLPTSTYRYNYRGGQLNLPPIKYYQLKSIVHKNAKQQPPRYFPVEPQAPHRILQKDPEGPVLGLGTKNMDTQKFLEPKEITKTVAPQEISVVCKNTLKEFPLSAQKPLNVSERTRKFFAKYGMDPETVARLTHKHRWTSTTQHHNGEACLSVIPVQPPSSTLEEKSDMIRLKGQRYEAKPEEWQATVLWDKIQLRGTVQHRDLEKKSVGVPEKLLNRRLKEGKAPEKFKRLRIDSPKLRRHIAEDNIHTIYIRQCPGYAGFVPRQPPKVGMEKLRESPQMTSVMKSSYRELPMKVYNPQIFARKGPMSKTVTLTYPFNPFNKITDEPVLLS